MLTQTMYSLYYSAKIQSLHVSEYTHSITEVASLITILFPSLKLRCFLGIHSISLTLTDNENLQILGNSDIFPDSLMNFQ